MASKTLIGVIVALIVIAIGVVLFTQFWSNGAKTGTEDTVTQGGQATPSLGAEEEQQPFQEPPPIIRSEATEFFIEADDRGFYIDGADIGSISADSGETLKITFSVRSTGVYYNGLDFKGCGLNIGKAGPGDSIITVPFTPSSTCTITSYWPSSSRVKDNLQVIVG